MQDNIFKKYNLPSKVKVVLNKTEEGNYIATFPEHPGCFTEADDVIDLLYQVNDALFTYYDVPRKELKDIDFLYSPPLSFLRDFQKRESKPQVKKSVEFHIPYPYNYA